ncbi:fic family toxin-antitoxin system, toxin component [Streptomyces sp. NPDC058683]|uniref:fic family toxin-antitoxin system, toxin component n=1 Tax=Streptomyces sp. NPDC058683 TaxID=3346597 RepID=UPI00365C6E37
MTAADSVRLRSVLELLGLEGPEPAAEPVANSEIDLAWLLRVAERIAGDPAVADFGSLVAAVSRIKAEIFGLPVYPSPYDRAAALLVQLIHNPALDRSNALFATSVAYAYLARSGKKINSSPEQARDLALLAKESGNTHAVSSVLRSFS